jgi:hypothetical protein
MDSENGADEEDAAEDDDDDDENDDDVIPAASQCNAQKTRKSDRRMAPAA